MQTHRMIIRRHGQLLGHFDSSVPAALEAIKQLIAQLPSSEGFEHEMLASKSERRIVEVSGAGEVRVLSRETIFE